MKCFCIALASDMLIGNSGRRSQDSVSDFHAAGNDSKPPSFNPNGPTHSYPKHIWSPAGGWYAQPSNWRGNTAVAGLAIFAVTAAVWKLSAETEYRHKMPEPNRFYPSR